MGHRRLVISFLAFFMGCGGTTQTPLGGVDGSTSISNLSPSDAEKVCEGIVLAFNPSQLCTIAGVAASALGQSCTMVEQVCAVDAGVGLADASTAAAGVACTAAPNAFAGCMATVDQLTTCVNAIGGALGGLTCSSNTADIDNALTGLADSCKALLSCEATLHMLPGLSMM